MTRTYRLLGLLAVSSLTLAACGSDIKPGAENVESGAYKRAEAPQMQGTANGDSLTAGLTRNPKNQLTGKQVYKNTDKALDTNHDGLADDSSVAK